MAAVYRARDTRLERDVAVKLLARDLQADPVYHQRFEREAKLSAQLRHPNLIEVFDVALSGDEDRYLVMELLHGERLGARAARGAMPVEEFLPIATQIAAGVSVLHAAKVVHRDLSANNVMLVTGGSPSEPGGGGPRVKVLDLGIARARDAQTLTEPGNFVGTLESMAPEQIRGDEVGAPADVYALGVLFYRMLTGAPPFKGEPATLIYQHLEVAPARMVTPAPLPEGLAALVSWCLEKAPSSRPADAAEVHAALARLARGEPVVQRPPVAAPTLAVPELGAHEPRGAALPVAAPPSFTSASSFGTGADAGQRPLETVLEPEEGRAGEPLELQPIARKTESLVAATPLVCATCGVVLQVSSDVCPSCGVRGMSALTPFRPAAVVRAPLPPWLVPLGVVRQGVSKRVGAYTLGLAVLVAVFGAGWASLLFALVSALAWTAFYVRHRLDDEA